MPKLPRIAFGALHPKTDHQPMLWALLDVLERNGVDVQTFCSQACFVGVDRASAITGCCHRHLDTWLMSSEVCRELFWRSAQACDLAVVEGCFHAGQHAVANSPSTYFLSSVKQQPCGVGFPPIATAPAAQKHPGGSLDDLCDWLDLPRFGVLNAFTKSPSEIATKRPAIAGLFLDNVQGMEHFCRAKTELEALWGIPVLGALEPLPSARTEVHQRCCEHQVSREACRRLGENLLRYLDIEQLMKFARRRDFGTRPLLDLPTLAENEALQVAVAFDEAFHCYFPDTLDLLESGGATVKTFSPLRDESLPQGTDLVYFGCGQPEKHAEVLARNCCMHAAIRAHVRRQGRVYAEGSGVAYLGRNMVLPNGSHVPMVGALTVDAHWQESHEVAIPTETQLTSSSWLGNTGTKIRGYLNRQWRLEVVEETPASTHTALDSRYMLSYKQLVGSLLHLHFAAQPDLLTRFFSQTPQTDLAGQQVSVT